MKWHWVLRGSIYKMGSTNWGGPTPPTLKTKWISILFCARPRPSCRPNRRDAFATEVRAHRPAGLPLSMPSCWQGNGYVMSRKVASSYNLVQSRRFFNKRANSYIGGYTFYFAHDPTHFLEKTGGGMHLLYRLGPNEPNSKRSLEENLWHVGSATSTEASLRVARLWLGWLPSQEKLPLHDGQGRTWQTCHCSWNVKSTIIKAGLPQHKPGSPWESWLLHTTSQLHLVALHHLYSGPFSILLADGCPQVAILTQLPFAVEMLAQIWAK